MTRKHSVNVEGQSVSAAHHKADSKKWIFFCHGFGINKNGSYEKRAERAVSEAFNAVRFDFRGNGGSEGEFINQNLSSRIKDLKRVIEYFDPDKYILFGSSFGGKVIFHASTDLNPEALIGRAPVTYNIIMNDYRREVEEKGRVEKIPGKRVDQRFFQDFDNYSFEDVEGELDVPVKIFHGDSDELVKIGNTWKAAKNLHTDLSVNKLRNEGHSFSESAEKKMRDQMFSWLETL